MKNEELQEMHDQIWKEIYERQKHTACLSNHNQESDPSSKQSPPEEESIRKEAD